jgi:iron complex outermembrane recepter protein
MMASKILRLRIMAGSAIGAIAILGSPTALAAQEAPADDSSSGLNEIVVTAQKREENLQKVPATITALSAEQLETRQIQDVAGLQSSVPSLVVGAYYGTSNITLRGISTGITSGAEDPSVATHINGVYQSRSRSVDSAMADLARVEVLAGPQGTLYGRNATGGVINYVLIRPSSEFKGEVSGRIGNYKRYGIQGRVTGPISDNVRVLVSGIYDTQDKGYATNLLPNAPRKTMDKSRSAGGRFALDIGNSDGINVQLDAIYLDTKTTPVSEALAPPGEAYLVAFLGPQSTVPHKTYSNLAAFTHSKYLQTSATLEIPLSDTISLKSITAYQDFKDTMLIDGDSSGVASVETLQNIDSKTFTQELNLNLEAVDGRLKSIFGAFYFDDDFLGQSNTPFSVPGFAASFDTYSKIRGKSYAFFTDHTFSVTDRFRVQGGIRYNHDKKTATMSLLVGGFPVAPLLTLPSKISTAWTPRIGAQFDVTDDIMLYGQWSEGFKSGGYTSNSAYDDFDPESIQGFEVGIKAKLLDNRVRFNLSGYHYKIANLQVQKVVDVGTFFVDNAAAAKIYGAEFTLNALLADNLEFDAAGMVQSAKYTDFLNCDETAFLGACGSGDTRPPSTKLTDVSGNWLNRAAPYSLNLGLQYTADVGGGKLVLRGESYFSGKVRFSEFGGAVATQEAYSLQNAFLTFTPDSDQFTLRAYVKNIGNTDYKRSYFYLSALRQPTGNYGAPRTFGIEGTVRF